jgi:hypothetical protein
MKMTTLQLSDEDHAILARYRRKCQKSGQDMNRVIIDAIRAELEKDEYSLGELAYDLRRSEEETLELLKRAGFVRVDTPPIERDELGEEAQLN